MCVEFDWFGCGGTANKFETKEKCEQSCKKKTGKGNEMNLMLATLSLKVGIYVCAPKLYSGI